MHHRLRPHRLAALVVASAVAVAACGSDDDADQIDPPSTDAPEETDAPEPDTGDGEATDEPDDAGDATDDDVADTDAGDEVSAESDDGSTFPVTIEHKFGETTIGAAPERVVSVGFAEHDGVLALGVTPVGVRDWYGDQPYGTWPWAQDELGDAEPELLQAAELDFEQIAALDPDVILGIGSGMSDGDYELLAEIAPTVAQPADYPDYGTPWREQLLITGRALGLETEAEEVIADTEQLFADARAANPEFEGATASVAFTFEELPGAYATNDIRSQVMTDLGFVIPPEFDDLAGDAFFFNVSQEELTTLDADVLVWIVSSEAGYEAIRAMPLRPTLTAYAEGREVVADPLLTGAFSHSSPLSLEYVIEELVPELALAVDGDVATAVPSTRLLEDGANDGVDESDDAAQAAAAAWSLVFDSTVAYDDKAAHLADAEALRDTVESYTTAGEAMGGITLEPTDVFVDGDVATVTYDVLFGSNAAYTALEGTITNVDGTWTVSREEFCAFMASARNACPTT